VHLYSHADILHLRQRQGPATRSGKALHKTHAQFQRYRTSVVCGEADILASLLYLPAWVELGLKVGHK
jgi:hypothetical protein